MPKYYRRPRRLTRAEKILASKQGVEFVSGFLVQYEDDDRLILLDPKSTEGIIVCKKRKER